MKALNRFISAVLALIIAGAVFVYFSPDYNVYFVKSESMVPAINMGDGVFIGPVNGPLRGEVEPGRIVTYQRGDAMIIHRVLSIDGDTLVTKGDAVEEPDAWAVSMSDVTGVYLFRVPYLGYFSNFVRTKVGFVSLIVIPGIVLIALLIRGIRKELRKNAGVVKEGG